jgi:rubrerythrin
MKTNIPTDHIRWLARMSEDEQRAAMPAFRDSVTRFLDRDDRTDDETASVLLGGLTRRSLFRVGGVTIAGAALLAACGSDSGATATTVAPPTTPSTPSTMVPTTMAPATTTPMGAVDDVTWLRTASSIEHLAVAAYQTAIDSGLVTTMAVADAAMRFQDHHMEHADFFEAATKKMGGKAFTDPNPAVLAQLQPAIKALKDEKGVIALALMLERAAAATYQSGVGNVADLTLNKALMSVGGVEARHAAVLAGALGEMSVPRSFGTIDGAVPVGTGV